MSLDRQHPSRTAAGLDEDFDRALRTRHRDALDNLSPRVRAQLQQRLRALRPPAASTRRRNPAWGLAAACSLALVLAFGVHRRIADGNSPAFASNPASAANNDSGELVATLDEAPDLYVWLASDDANHILSE
jgi:hypothetical protein